MHSYSSRTEFFHDKEHTPVEWKVSHWSENPYSQGAWSQLRVNGSPSDRVVLGSPISDALILAGEACTDHMPSMVHGAAYSGLRAANMMYESASDGALSYVVIGAGAAGIYAASRLRELAGNENVIVLEARDRIGGRVHTVDIGRDSSVKSVKVDLGATWLQQFPTNFMAEHAVNRMELDVVPTCFHDALCSASNGRSLSGMRGIVERVYDHVWVTVNDFSGSSDGGKEVDLPLMGVLQQSISRFPRDEQFLAHLAVAGDINSDLGYDLDDTSAVWGLEELGVGNEDHYIKQGYVALLDSEAEGLNVRLSTPVTHIDWSGNRVVATTATGEIICADKCICTVPISVIQNRTILFSPNLPEMHMKSLDRIRMGCCEKVILRYTTRWWPKPVTGLCRWYDTSCYAGDMNELGEYVGSEFPMILDWVEWLDMTDGVGEPVVMGFCVGKRSVDKYHKGSDESIALAAAKAFEMWAWNVITSS